LLAWNSVQYAISSIAIGSYDIDGLFRFGLGHCPADPSDVRAAGPCSSDRRSCERAIGPTYFTSGSNLHVNVCATESDCARSQLSYLITSKTSRPITFVSTSLPAGVSQPWVSAPIRAVSFAGLELCICSIRNFVHRHKVIHIRGLLRFWLWPLGHCWLMRHARSASCELSASVATAPQGWVRPRVLINLPRASVIHPVQTLA